MGRRSGTGAARSQDDDIEELAAVTRPAICLALLARHLPRGAGPILDAATIGRLGRLRRLGRRVLLIDDLLVGEGVLLVLLGDDLQELLLVL